jgi:hypothetical protein
MLLKTNAQLFPNGLQLLQVLLVLRLVLDLVLQSYIVLTPLSPAPKTLHTLKDPHGSREVVYSSGSF